MTSSGVPRSELMAAVIRASRRESSQAALFSQAVAERIGLAVTDVECLDSIQREGRVTVGRLAELTGLTTGSATRMVDRLEQAGFVRRVADPSDRRRVMVEEAPGVHEKLGALHGSLIRAATSAIERYSDDELRLIADYLDRGTQLILEETIKMRAPSEAPDAGGSYAAPVGGVTSGRLVFLSGAPKISVRGDATLTELYTARFEGPVPRMRVRDGVVTVSYPRFGWFDWRAQVVGQKIEASAHWRKDTGEIVLNSTIPWAIELRGGLSQWTADLRTIRLVSFELRGGASRIELILPRPNGVVPIRIAGGMSEASIERPDGVPIRLQVHGGLSKAIIDGRIHQGAGGMSIETPGAAEAHDRYEIDLSGGVSKIHIGTR